MPTRTVAAWLLLATPALAAAAGERPFGWRGDGTGVFDVDDAPERCLGSAPAWEASLPGPAHASPVLAGDRVLVLSEPDLASAHALSDGRVLWTRRLEPELAVAPDAREAFRAARERARVLEARLEAIGGELAEAARRARRGGDATTARARVSALHAERDEATRELARLAHVRTPRVPVVGVLAATPVAADGVAYVLAAERWVFALRLGDGEVLWARELSERRTASNAGHHEGAAASPTLADGRLLVPGPRLVWLDAATGATVREGPAFSGFGTPLQLPGRAGAVVDGAGLRGAGNGTGPDAAAGAALLFASPVWAGGVALLAGSFLEQGPLTFRELGHDAPATPPRAVTGTGPHPRSYYASPLVLGDDVWAVSEAGRVTVFSRRSGAQVAVHDLAPRALPGGAEPSQAHTVFASPAATRRHVYVVTPDDQLAALERASPHRVVARRPVGATTASPVFSSDGRLVVRTDRALMAFACSTPPAGPSRSGPPRTGPRRRRG